MPTVAIYISIYMQQLYIQHMQLALECMPYHAIELLMYHYIVAGEIELVLVNTTSELTVNEDVGDVIISVSLNRVLSQQFVVNYRFISGTASKESLIIYIAI